VTTRSVDRATFAASRKLGAKARKKVTTVYSGSFWVDGIDPVEVNRQRGHHGRVAAGRRKCDDVTPLGLFERSNLARWTLTSLLSQSFLDS